MKAKHSRPVEESHLEIADTFQDAGTRPIEESPDYLVPEVEAEVKNNLSRTDSSSTSKDNQ